MQEKYFNEIINIKRSNRKSENKTVTKNFMLWVEHTPVITLGKSGKDKNLLLNKNELKKKKLNIIKQIEAVTLLSMVQAKL